MMNNVQGRDDGHELCLNCNCIVRLWNMCGGMCTWHKILALALNIEEFPHFYFKKIPYEGLELSWLSLLRRHFSTQGEIYTRIVFRSTLISLRFVTVYRTYFMCTWFCTLCVYPRRKHAITNLDAWLLIMNCRLVWEITYLAVEKEMERVIMLNFTSTTLIFYVSAICFIKQNRTCIEWDNMSHFD